METVYCKGHNAPCMLKTGSKPGPNFGKRFYICSVLKNKCDFVQPTESVPISCCLKHPEYTADLQSIVVGKISGEKRHFYRCSQATVNEKNWCGYSVIDTVSKVAPLKDNNNRQAIGDLTDNSGPKSKDQYLSGKEQVVIQSSSQGASLGEGPALLLPSPSESSRQTGKAVESASSLVDRNMFKVAPEQSKPKPTLTDSKNSDFSLDTNKASNAGKINSQSPKVTPVTETVTDPLNPASESGQKIMTGGNFVSHRETIVIEDDDEDDDSPPTSLAERIRNKSGSCPLESKPDIKISERTSGLEQAEKKPPPQPLPVNRSSTQSAPTDESGRQTETSGHPTGFLKASDLVMVTETTESIRGKVFHQLKQKKQMVGMVNMGQLPDNGERLKRQVKELEQQLAFLDLKITNNGSSNVANVPGSQAGPPVHGVHYSHKVNQGQPQVYTVYPSSSKPGQPSSTFHIPQHSSQAPPAPGMRQTLILDHAQPLPAHVLQQMYAANPQMMTLYGGRMTAARLREVGSVTTEAIEKLHKQLESCPTETEEVSDPKGLNIPLMIHQRQGLAWLIWREQQQPSGGILADDMGLGKTLTMISLVIKQRDRKQARQEEVEKKGDDSWLNKDKTLEKLDKNIVKSRASLVICPASVIHQWFKEIERRCRSGVFKKVLLYHGPNREKNLRRLADNDIVLTTYNIVSKEVGADVDAKTAEKPVEDDAVSEKKPEDEPNLLSIGWERVILDEAHNIKNHKCKTSVAVCRLRAGCRWALTGTPIQNDLIDMYALLRFLRVSPFDEYKVWKRQVETNSGNGKARLNTLVKSLLLRRTKDQVSKEGKPLVPLPSKSTFLHRLKLSEEERKVYEKVYTQSRSTFKDYLKRHAEKTGETITYATDPVASINDDRNPFMDKGAIAPPGSSGDGQDGQKKPGASHILVLLLRLRQCCSHLSLMKGAIEDEVMETEGIELSLEEQMRGMMLEEGEGSQGTKPLKADIFQVSSMSTKITAMMEKLLELRDKSTCGKPLKSVVVSQWTKMLEIVGLHLNEAGFRYSIIQGNIVPKKRMEAVDDFNMNPNGPEVMLVSLRAGGVGLNLIGGSNLFLLDQHWNPALEEQACDRIYRVGQKNDVFIHRFLCTDTVEEKIAELQKRKTSLAKDILSGSGAAKQKLTLSDLRHLFGV